MKARVIVTLKPGVLDPQGKAIEGALKSLGLGGVSSVRQGKVFDVELDGLDGKQAKVVLEQAAEAVPLRLVAPAALGRKLRHELGLHRREGDVRTG